MTTIILWYVVTIASSSGAVTYSPPMPTAQACDEALKDIRSITTARQPFLKCVPMQIVKGA